MVWSEWTGQLLYEALVARAHAIRDGREWTAGEYKIMALEGDRGAMLACCDRIVDIAKELAVNPSCLFMGF